MDALHQLADEIRETFEDRGHSIGQAVRRDPAFQKNRRSQSSLGRDLFVDATESACGRLGLNFRIASGNAAEIIVLVDSVYRHYRLRKAKWNPDADSFDVLGDPSILTIEDDGDGIYRAERWLLGYTAQDDEMVSLIFAAKVVGVSSESVSRLQLGPATILGTAGATPPEGGGFRPADEDDLGFDDDSEQDGDADAI